MDHIIILAGGRGTRMKSEEPKVLHKVAGIPIIKRLLESVFPLCEKPSVIINHDGDKVKEATGNKCDYIFQAEQKGTGHAVMVAKDKLSEKGHKRVLVLPGDHPLVSRETLKNLTQLHKEKNATITVATTEVPDFEGERGLFYHFGRVLRDEGGGVERILEFKDATEEEREVREVNLGYYCFDSDWLWQNIEKLGDDNAAGEYYLTDMVSIAGSQGKNVEGYIAKDYMEGMGINTPEQLKIVENYLREKE